PTGRPCASWRRSATTVAGEIPLWIKVAYTLMVAVIVPVYLAYYGPANFLWFSDVALVVTGVALWLESPLLVSMMTVGVLLPELHVTGVRGPGARPQR